MSFNEIDIFLFEKYFSSKTDSKSLLNMIQMNFNEKLDKANEIKIINRLYDLPYIIINYLYYQVNRKILIKEKFSFLIANELYSELLNSYNNLIKDIKSKFNFDKIPYKYFIEEDDKNKSNLNTVIGALIGEDNSKLEVFRLQREQKEYFKTLKNLRTFNLLNKKIG